MHKITGFEYADGSHAHCYILKTLFAYCKPSWLLLKKSVSLWMLRLHFLLRFTFDVAGGISTWLLRELNVSMFRLCILRLLGPPARERCCLDIDRLTKTNMSLCQKCRQLQNHGEHPPLMTPKMLNCPIFFNPSHTMFNSCPILP